MKVHKDELFLFDDISQSEGGRDQHIVVISSLDQKTLNIPGGKDIETPYIVAYLQNEFNYSVAAQWESLLDGVVGGGLLTKVGQFTGNPLFQSGLFKRKFYQGGGYIEFNIDIRIVSDASYKVGQMTEGGQILNPKTAAHWLASLCLPTTDPSVLEAVKSGIQFGKKLLNNAGDEIAIATGDDKYAKKMQVERGKEAIKDALEANDKPYGRTCRIKIGNMFDSFDMVIDAVDIKYSRESVYSGNSKGNSKFKGGPTTGGDDGPMRTLSKNTLQAYQPLYVDVSLRVSTRTVPSVDKAGFANTGLLTPQPSVSLASELEDIIYDGGLNE